MEIVRRVATDMPSSGQRVRIEGDPDGCGRIDPVLLTLAVRNLLENAISHSDGPVLGSARKAVGGIEIVVEDEGPGIPVDELPRATDRFFRGRARSAAGSGLGLSITKEAVTRMGGSLALTNRQPRGLTATLSIPTATA